MNDWIAFATVIGIQLAFFFLCAYRTHQLKETPRLLGWGVLLGIPFGTIFDLFIGEYVGIFNYELGFTPLFLLVNGALSYGIFIATVLLLQRHSFFHFYCYLVLLAFVYEVVNYLAPVWNWQFMDAAWAEYAILLLAAYQGLALIVVGVVSLYKPFRFRFL